MKLYIRKEYDRMTEILVEGETVKVGHDDSQCQLWIDYRIWPMVAGVHAEFRSVNNSCYLLSKLPTSDIFIEGEKIYQSTPIQPGMHVQFGSGGPAIRVLQIDLSNETPSERRKMNLPQQPAPQQPAPQQTPQPQPPDNNQIAPKDQKARKRNAYIEVESDVTVNTKGLELNKEIIRLGRALESDLIFDANAAVISKTHAEIRRQNENYILNDLNSFNGTFLNQKRINAPEILQDGDVIQLGMSGPVIRFNIPGLRLSPRVPSPVVETTPQRGALIPKTVVVNKNQKGHAQTPDAQTNRELLYALPLGVKSHYKIGRAPGCDIRLDGLQISKHHASLFWTGPRIFIEDENSTNGVYINGSRLFGKTEVLAGDSIQIGPFIIQVDHRIGIQVFDTRSRTRIDAVSVTKIVSDKTGTGKLKLLDGISLTIQPNEFVGLLGPSGAGKSTFMDALNGMRPATSGQVLINNTDLNKNIAWLKQAIGYVPQDDIIHKELTVYKTLYYVAKLRLSHDASSEEVEQIVSEVMDLTGLTERRDVPISHLSGGQRKRVSIAVELITKPSVIFLDEPTSGLDPATEEKIMLLFRQIADSGRTVILTTHAMENVQLFDKIVVLMRGKLVFYGSPQEALAHCGAKSFKELYDKLEEPIARRVAQLAQPVAASEQQRAYKKQTAQIAEEVSEEWKQKFVKTTFYKQNVLEPQQHSTANSSQTVDNRDNKIGIIGSVHQWMMLSLRYAEVLLRDKFNLLILFGQAPIIAFLTWMVVMKDSPRDFLFFILSLVSIWFGISVAAREIIRERAIYNRERMVNLRLLPYIGSKLWVLSMIVGTQCVILFFVLKMFSLAGLLKFPSLLGGLPQLFVMMLTAMVGLALGLAVSASVKTSEMATSLVPLILIPQILFSGLVGVQTGAPKLIGSLMPATWSFDEIKRLSANNVKVLKGKTEEAEPASTNDGLGLYKHIKRKNDEEVERKDRELKDYKAKADEKIEEFRKKMDDYQRDVEQWNLSGRRGPKPEKPKDIELDSIPAKPVIEFVPDDLSDYVDFLHPWGNLLINPVILLIMFFGLVGFTLITLRSQDV